MGNKYFVCLICCKEFKSGCGGGRGDLERKEENVENLKQFCEVVLEVDRRELEGKNGLTCFHGSYNRFNSKRCGGGDLSGSKEGQQRPGFGGDLMVKKEDEEENNNQNLSKFLNNPSDNLSICGNCLDLIGMVTEARLSAKCVEESVEKLQGLLLRELRRLQGRLDLFRRKFEKIEETLVNGDLEFMGNNLNESYSERKEGGEICQEHLERSKEIVGFRVKISKVFRDFTLFHSKFVDKIACNNPVVTICPTKPIRLRRAETGTVAASKSSKKMVDSDVPKVKKKKKINDKQPDKDNDKGIPSPFPAEPHQETDNDDDKEDDNDWEDEPMHLGNSDDITITPETVPADKRQSLRRRRVKMKDNQKSSNSGGEDDPQISGEDDDDDDEYIPGTSKSSNLYKTKSSADKRLRGRTRTTNKKKDIPKLVDSEEEDEEEQNSSEDNDQEYNPKPMNNMNLGYNQRTVNWLRENASHLAKMSPFKRNLIENIIKCRHLHDFIQKRKGLEKMNVYRQHLIHLSYNLDTQLINLKDIPIKIVCQAEQENEENGLLCMKCDFKVPEGPKIEKVMWEHVLSKHLNAFQCPHCRVKQLGTYRQYFNHTRSCPEVSKVECDICGKTLVSRSLQHHKWGHMNEQERAEALKSGLVKKDPSINSIKGKDKIFQCTQCGKSLATKQGLLNHEETHKDKWSREQFICAKCGKSFLRSGYEYHLKYSESCGEMDTLIGRTVRCGKCGKVLKNKTILGHHMRWTHRPIGETNSFCCSTCGKIFEKRGSWINHEKTHLTERKWICGRCGKGFKTSCHVKRHEKTCAK